MATDSTNKKASAPHASPLYRDLVGAYQALWPAIAGKRIHRAIRSLNIEAGAKVLEVGVGTGVSLPAYPDNVEVTGIDLSEAMLGEAIQLIARRQWRHVHVLPMNAEQLEFDDSSFDVVTSFHTISVVSDPGRMMREIVRVCRPGGRILLINHFRSHHRLVARVVDAAGALTRSLGWRTDLGVAEILKDLPLTLDESYKTNPLSLFTIVTATCRKADDAAGQSHSAAQT